MEDVQLLMEASVRFAEGAGAILQRKWTEPRTVEHKGVADLVTDADKASEKFLITEVQRAFPHHAILAEESGARGSTTAAITWVMDPLDGTTNYAHGFPHFNVSVAACGPDGRALAGCVFDPVRRETFAASVGQGAWLRTPSDAPQKLRVTRCARLEDALLITGFPYDRARHADNNHPEHDAFSLACHGVRRTGAAALDLAWVAAGRADGYWEAHLAPWDLAAGVLLVAEAGGTVSLYGGEPFTGRQSAVVTAGPALHPLMVERLAQVRTERGFPPAPKR